MYKIKIDVKITEGGKEVVSETTETDCDDYEYKLSACSREQYSTRYIRGVNVAAIWQENPDRSPKDD